MTSSDFGSSTNPDPARFSFDDHIGDLTVIEPLGGGVHAETYLVWHPNIRSMALVAKIIRESKVYTTPLLHPDEVTSSIEMVSYDLTLGSRISHLKDFGIYPAFIPISPVKDRFGNERRGYAGHCTFVNSLEPFLQIAKDDPLRKKKFRDLMGTTAEQDIFLNPTPPTDLEIVNALRQAMIARKKLHEVSLQSPGQREILIIDPTLGNTMVKRAGEPLARIAFVDFSKEEVARSLTCRTVEELFGEQYNRILENKTLIDLIGWGWGNHCPSGFAEIFRTSDPRQWLGAYRQWRNADEQSLAGLVKKTRSKLTIAPKDIVAHRGVELSDFLVEYCSPIRDPDKFTEDRILEQLDFLGARARKSITTGYQQKKITIGGLGSQLVDTMLVRPIYQVAEREAPYLVNGETRKQTTCKLTDVPGASYMAHLAHMYIHTGRQEFLDKAVSCMLMADTERELMLETPAGAAQTYGIVPPLLYQLTKDERFRTMSVEVAQRIRRDILLEKSGNELFFLHTTPDRDSSENVPSILYKAGVLLWNLDKICPADNWGEVSREPYSSSLEKLARNVYRNLFSDGLHNLVFATELLAQAHEQLRREQAQFREQYRISRQPNEIQFLSCDLAAIAFASHHIKKHVKAPDVREYANRVIQRFAEELVLRNYELPYDLFNPNLGYALTKDNIGPDMNAMVGAAHAASAIATADPSFEVHAQNLHEKIFQPQHISDTYGLVRGSVFYNTFQIRRQYSSQYVTDFKAIRNLIYFSLLERKENEKAELLLLS